MTTKEQTDSKDEAPDSKASREKKIMNIIVNTSIMLMSTLMGGLTELMVNATSAVASEMTEATNGEAAGKEIRKEIKQKLPDVDKKMKTMISDVRKDLYAQLEQKRKEIAPFLSDATFDIGLKIIDKYEFKLPKLTEELDDNTLARYAQLMTSEDHGFTEMFQELTSWMNTLPKLPEQNEQKDAETSKLRQDTHHR